MVTHEADSAIQKLKKTAWANLPPGHPTAGRASPFRGVDRQYSATCSALEWALLGRIRERQYISNPN